MQKNNNVNQFDYEIICELKKNARISCNKIAKKLKVNPKTVKQHMDKLIHEGVITPTVIVNSNFFGYNNIVDVFVWCKKDQIEVIQTMCEARKNNIIYFSKHWEDATISLQGKFKTMKDLYDFVEYLQSLPGIEKLQYSIVPEVIFDSDSWIPNPEDFLNIY